MNVTVCCEPVTLVRVPEMSPDPEADIPVTLAVLVLVHENVVPGRLLLVERAIAVMGTSEQSVWVAGVATATGSGLRVTVAVIGSPTQPLYVGVMVNVTICGEPVTLVSVPAI